MSTIIKNATFIEEDLKKKCISKYYNKKFKGTYTVLSRSN